MNQNTSLENAHQTHSKDEEMIFDVSYSGLYTRLLCRERLSLLDSVYLPSLGCLPHHPF